LPVWAASPDPCDAVAIFASTLLSLVPVIFSLYAFVYTAKALRNLFSSAGCSPAARSHLRPTLSMGAWPSPDCCQAKAMAEDSFRVGDGDTTARDFLPSTGSRPAA
jgi:hypothetical protein